MKPRHFASPWSEPVERIATTGVDLRCLMGSLHELLPTGARRLEYDDDVPDIKEHNVSFRLVRDTTGAMEEP